jgi:hypothetical protein
VGEYTKTTVVLKKELSVGQLAKAIKERMDYWASQSEKANPFVKEALYLCAFALEQLEAKDDA